VVLKAQLILETFNSKERFYGVDTYQKETFDLLWKILKVIKPIVAIFTPPDTFLFDSMLIKGANKIAIKDNTKEITLDLTDTLIQQVKKSIYYNGFAKVLLECYETITNNLVGYVDILPFIKNYNSKIGLYKYALGLAQEGEILKNTTEDYKKINTRYLQGLLVINLILKEHYDSMNEKVEVTDKVFMEYEILGENDKRIDRNNDLEANIKEALQFNAFNKLELVYINTIKTELYNKSIKTKP